MKIFILFSVAVTAYAETVPPPFLSETGLYQNILLKIPSFNLLAFEPQYPLWTDGALKKRWIYLPPGSQIQTQDVDRWVFPVGTKSWKEFRFPDTTGTKKYKRIETRYLEKLEDGSWLMATYLWNEEETEATLAPFEGIAEYYAISDSVKINVPSVAQCRFCHERGGDKILGFDSLQLSWDRDPNALHAKHSGITLRYLQRKNLLTYFPEEWKTHPPRIESFSDTERSAVGYLHGNCGHCHNPSGRANLSGLFLRYDLNVSALEEQPFFITGINQLTLKFKIPGLDTTYRFKGQDLERSASYYRMNSLSKPSMPPIGRKVLDFKALDLMRKWIAELPQ